MDDFIPSEMLKRTLRWWWLLVILMIAGGIVGVLISRFQKPVFESQASITTSIDFAYANRLDDHDEDFLISTVGDVISSSQVFESVKQQASELDISISDDQITQYFTKARQGFRWELTVRNSVPQVAQTLAQLWVEAAGSALAELREHTLDSIKYHTAEISLQNCFSQMVVVEPASASCSTEKLTEIRNALEATSTEQDLSAFPDSILLSKISTEISDSAYLPAGPIVFKLNLMGLAGCVCGLLFGLSVFIFGKYPKP